jgi:hypothetical protein
MSAPYTALSTHPTSCHNRCCSWRRETRARMRPHSPCLVRINTLCDRCLPTTPSSFLAHALMPRRPSHNADSFLCSTQRHTTLRVMCTYLLSGAFAHSGSLFARPDPTTFAHHPRWQDSLNPTINTTYTGERQRVSAPCPSPNRARTRVVLSFAHIHARLHR